MLASPTLPWLTSLKAAQLQRIARATGLQSTGTKAALLARIEDALLHPRGGEKATTPAAADVQTRTRQCAQGLSGKPMSILSIDMGIRNFAFAHLRVAPDWALQGGRGDGSGVLRMPELTAWHRLAVSELTSSNLRDSLGMEAIRSSVDVGEVGGSLEGRRLEGEGESFSLERYAASAYTLVSTLLAMYEPSHVLIERQRFRSGGGSAVQEWTLRVGVLEGMLYAVLHALRQEREGDIADIEVLGIEPRRVVRYWMDGDIDTNSVELNRMDDLSEKEAKQKLTAREVKKAKIDLVGRWLTTSLVDHSEVQERASGVVPVPKFRIADSSPVTRILAQAYLQKWQGKSTNRRKSPSSVQSVSDIAKLDDLADCLLQGVTWLEWKIMRQRLRHEGARALK